MPGKPPRRASGRKSTRPGVRREPRLPAGGVGGEGAPDLRGEDRAEVHAEARSKVISTFTMGAYRIIVVAATIAVLTVSFVSSFSVYLGQQRDIAAAKAEKAAYETEIARLQDELQRWQDPAYVRAQARERLGWVMPGEVGYRVIDADGQVIGGTVRGLEAGDEEDPGVWYDTLWMSLQAADRPAGE